MIAPEIEALLPRAQSVLVANEYPSRPDFEAPALTRRFGRNELHRLLKAHPQIRMPAISPKIWGHFERANRNPADVIASDPKDLIEIAGDDIDTVEIMQGRIANWLNRFSTEISPLVRNSNG